METTDLTNLQILDETYILRTLRERLCNGQIYTNTGPILIALNPYKTLPIYDDDHLRSYTSTNPEPHIFATANATFTGLKNTKRNQSVIISGESGAGKTESTKLILQFLTTVSSTNGWIEQMILETNSILESFGNAKTSRNNNSSRFGKFIQVQFNPALAIVGASITPYLLEKSRVTKNLPPERNYHIFYQLLSDPPKGLNLENTTFNYIQTASDAKDKKGFEKLKMAFSILGMPEEGLQTVYQMLAAILHLGNVKVTGENARIVNEDAVLLVAEYLGIPKEHICEWITIRSITVRGETSRIPLTSEQAVETRDSLAKNLYSSLFNYLIIFINSAIAPKEDSSGFVGVLDIFGFEHFDTNGYEQFVINYANEKLQSEFVRDIFQMEKQEYDNEGLSIQIEYSDNQASIDLIESKAGIMPLLNEESRFPKATDTTLLAKLHTLSLTSAAYIKPKQALRTFGIKHYAGDVMYTVDGFLEKNKDNVGENWWEILSRSSNNIIADVFRVPVLSSKSETSGTMARPKSTAVAIFKSQLSELVATLGDTSPHYVRCIKPNSAKEALVFDADLVLAQLRYSGMLDTVRIRKLGFPNRMGFLDFGEKYHRLATGSNQIADARECCIYILQTIGLSDDFWAVGKSKIFLKSEAYVAIESMHEAVLAQSGHVVLCFLRMAVARRKYLRLQRAVRVLQPWCRCLNYRRRYLRMRSAAIVLQAATRGWFARDYVRQVRRANQQDIEQMPGRKEEVESDRANFVAPNSEKQFEHALAKMEKVQQNADLDALDAMFSFLDDIAPASPGVDAEFLDLMNDLTTSDTKPEDSKSEIKPENGSIVNETVDHTHVSDARKESIQPVPSQDQTAISKATTRKADHEPPKQMASNPLAKREAETTWTTSLKEKEYPFMDYAQKYFPLQQKAGGFGTMKKATNIESVISYTKSPTTQPLLEISEHLIEKALECFKVLIKGLDGFNKPEVMFAAVQSIQQSALEHYELRDELFCYLIRQTTVNEKLAGKNWVEILKAGWLIFAAICASFPPEKILSKYVYAHIQRTIAAIDGMSDMQSVSVFARAAELHLKGTMINGSRITHLTFSEFSSLKNQESTGHNFGFLDGNKKVINLSPVLCAGEVVKEMMTALNLNDFAGWSLYTNTSAGSDKALKSTDYIMDVINGWQLIEGKNIKLSEAAIAAQPNKSIFLKKRLFRDPLEPPQDPVEYSMLYSQAVRSNLLGEYEITEKLAVQLAALQAQVTFKDYAAEQQKTRFSVLKNFLSSNLISLKPVADWQREIEEQYKKLRGTANIQAKVAYLELIKRVPLYGAYFCNVTYKGFWSHPENVAFAVSHEGISIVHLKTREILVSYPYSRIDTYEYSVDEFTLQLVPESLMNRTKPLTEEEEDRSDWEKLTFITKQGEETIAMCHEYDNHRAETKSTERILDPKLVERQIVRVRKDLITKGILNLPGPESAKRSQAAYAIADWCYSKVTFLLTLDVLNAHIHGFNEHALAIHQAIFTYTGITPSQQVAQMGENGINLIQLIFNKCLEVPKCTEEMYLQLIKLTTRPAEPDGKVVLQAWKLLAMACGVMLPTIPEIKQLLGLHLQRSCIFEKIVLKNQPSHKQEAMHAKFCLKYFEQADKKKAIRTAPPSPTEVAFATSLAPLKIKVYFPDNQTRAFMTAPFTTVLQLRNKIVDKMSVRGCEGLYIFETFGVLEKCLEEDKMIGDILFKWDQFALQTHVPNILLFVFKKRLFFNPLQKSTNTTEEQMIFHQFMNDAMNGRYPLDEHERAYLIALQMQAELGDDSSATPMSYNNYVDKFIPASSTAPTSRDAVISQHRKLHGFSAPDCQALAMELAREWELFGSTLFDVQQGWSSDFPTNCWLAVNHEGVHLLAPGSKDALFSHPWNSISTFTPTLKAIVIVAEGFTNGTKYALNTPQAGTIALLMRDYNEHEALQAGAEYGSRLSLEAGSRMSLAA